MPPSRIVELASKILRETEQFDNYLQSKNLPSPSFAPDAPFQYELSDSASESRQAVIDATDELLDLILGPIGPLLYPDHTIFVSVHAIYRFGIATKFPKDRDEASYGEIAEACGLSEPETRRIIRHAMTRRIFQERKNGMVAHTATSKLLADSPYARDWSGLQTEELLPAATRIPNAISKWKGSQDPNDVATNLAIGDETKPFFTAIEEDGERSRRFANSMVFLNQVPGHEYMQAVEKYPWDRIGDSRTPVNGTVVDIGGSQGLAMIALAERFPHLSCVVQDQTEVVAGCQSNLPANLQERITYMAHDFYTPQPVHGADVYFMRTILHDWPDAYCIKILRALIPALTAGAKVLLHESYLPEPGAVSEWIAREVRSVDFGVWALHNGKEREEGEWKELFHDADPRFKHLGTTVLPGSKMALFEFLWDP